MSEDQFTGQLAARGAGAFAGLVTVAAARLVVQLAIKGTKGLPNGVPKNWKSSPSNKGGGVRYRNPNNKHDEVRSMPGNPNSSNASQRSPYVKRQADGKSYDVKGKEVPKNSPEAHIPKDDFKYIPRDKLGKKS